MPSMIWEMFIIISLSFFSPRTLLQFAKKKRKRSDSGSDVDLDVTPPSSPGAGRGGRGGSSRGREEVAGYNSAPRPGHQVSERGESVEESRVNPLCFRPEWPHSVMPLMSIISPDNTTTSYQVHSQGQSVHLTPRVNKWMLFYTVES